MTFSKKSYLLIAVAFGLAAIPCCSFFTNPDEVQKLGELEINIRFAGANSSTAKSNAGQAATALLKESSLLSPEAVDRIVVTVLEYSEFQIPNNKLSERVVIRREFRLGADRKVQAVLEVPLQNPEHNCFTVRVQALDGLTSLYSGEDFPCFEIPNRRAAANILLEPVAFRLLLSNNVPPINSRFFALNGQVQDTAVTQIEIVMADSVMVTLPVLGPSFSNPVMLFGSSSLVKVSAFGGKIFRGETSRRVTYTGRRADVLIALVWSEPVDLDLEVQNPLQQIISAAARGDSVGGNGFMQITDDGYGPEVFEWRQSARIPSGPFSVRVSRPRVGLPLASGKVYVFFREGQAQQGIQSFKFEFKQGDTQLVQNVYNFTWP